MTLDLRRVLDLTTSFAATAARLGAGMTVAGTGKRPAEPLSLYEFEACPFCRKVREALSILDLDAMVYPCPKGGPRYREEVKRRGGKAQFPYLVDPNTGQAMYESDRHRALPVHHVRRRHRAVGARPRAGDRRDGDARLDVAHRSGTDLSARPSPEKPLELWSFEASPFCRLVREELCSLELPYRLHNVAKGSAQREAFVARSGKMMVPYLFDPNTGTAMFESADIVRYLDATYAM